MGSRSNETIKLIVEKLINEYSTEEYCFIFNGDKVNLLGDNNSVLLRNYRNSKLISVDKKKLYPLMDRL